MDKTVIRRGRGITTKSSNDFVTLNVLQNSSSPPKAFIKGCQICLITIFFAKHAFMSQS